MRHAEFFLIGVDLRTGSVRAGVFALDGSLLGTANTPISLHREGGGIVEQSTTEI